MSEKTKEALKVLFFVCCLAIVGYMFFVYGPKQREEYEKQKIVEEKVSACVEINGTIPAPKKFCKVASNGILIDAFSDDLQDNYIKVECQQKLDVEVGLFFIDGKWYIKRDDTGKATQEQVRSFINSCVPLLDIEHDKIKAQEQNASAKAKIIRQTWGEK